MERHKKKRKRAQEQRRARSHLLSEWSLAGAADWPILECVVNEDWEEIESLAKVVIARQRPGGRVAMAGFVMDLGCLGAKGGCASLVVPSRYPGLRARLTGAARPVEISLDFAAKIVRAGIDYARHLGFSAHPDAVRALPLLGAAHPEDCADPVRLGNEDGLPVYIEDPGDDVAWIVGTLERVVGPEDFEYALPRALLSEDVPLPTSP